MIQVWPKLDWDAWKDTAGTVHMFTQIVGKTRVALTHTQNHWWNVPLYVTARGLTTSAMPTPQGGVLDIEFDFLAHQLVFRTSDGDSEQMSLRPRTVADFFAEYQSTLKRLKVDVTIHSLPVELPSPIRFEDDTIHKSYDKEAVVRFWRVLCQADALFKRFSTSFYGKISPVHFFWGSFDLAVTRFNGRRAPVRPGADSIQAEAYSHECISAGFWPGNGGYGKAAFYCYGAPVPPNLSEAVLRHSQGGFNSELGEFLLDYEHVQRSDNPTQAVLTFLSETYDSVANAAAWDRENLDRHDAIVIAAVSQ